MDGEKRGVERIMEETGLSRATVSRALNNCGSVSSEVKETVLRAAQAADYAPPQQRRVRRPEGGYLVAAALPEIPSYFWGEASRGMRDEAARHPQLRLVCSLFSRLGNESDALYCIDYLLALKPDVLIVALSSSQALRQRLMQCETPIVCFVEDGDLSPCFFVGADYYRDGVLLARTAAQVLPRRARLVKIESEPMPQVNLRDEGFRRELMNRAPEIEWAGSVSVAGLSAREAPSRLARALGDMSFDALYVSQGVLPQALQALNKLRRSDVQVVGYESAGDRFAGDTRLAAVLEQDIYGQGVQCIDAVRRFLEAGETPPDGKCLVGSHLWQKDAKE